MGELHFELVKHRLKKEFKLDVRLGDLCVNYKETVKRVAAHSETVKAVIQGVEHGLRVEACVQPLPKLTGNAAQTLQNLFILECVSTGDEFGEKELNAIQRGQAIFSCTLLKLGH